MTSNHPTLLTPFTKHRVQRESESSHDGAGEESDALDVSAGEGLQKLEAEIRELKTQLSTLKEEITAERRALARLDHNSKHF